MRLIVEGNGDTAGVTGFLWGSEGSIGFFSLLGGGLLPVHQPGGAEGAGGPLGLSCHDAEPVPFRVTVCICS